MTQTATVLPPYREIPTELKRNTILAFYRRVRRESEVLCEPLELDDYQLQSLLITNPPKWHLAHVSWFFETFLLEHYLENYPLFNPKFRILFNSYYEQVSQPLTRTQRGQLSRPTVEEIYNYRRWIDEQMEALIEQSHDALWSKIAPLVLLGIHHEQQHQELMLTDIKHNFWINPLYPAYRADLPQSSGKAASLEWHSFEGGLCSIGHGDEGFAYDNEQPRHQFYLVPFRLACRLVTNDEYLAFIDADGYRRPELWLSDGWYAVKREQWQNPLYWKKEGGDWMLFTLGGMRPLNIDEPVAHLSYYEADAFARWSGKRLPSEQEWEFAASKHAVNGNLYESGLLHPQVMPDDGMQQLFGDLWEWTASPYTPYPGFQAPSGALGGYNGKFMCNQIVLRGGSCTTSTAHIRATYRNFFYPNERWQFKGLRLAADAQ